MHVDLTNWNILPSPSEKNLPLQLSPVHFFVYFTVVRQYDTKSEYQIIIVEQKKTIHAIEA